jgi:hypothetical protein
MVIEPSMLQRNGFLRQRESVGDLRPDRFALCPPPPAAAILGTAFG